MSDTAVPNEEFLADLEEAMRDVVDPELGINVVDLGLVYGVNVEEGDAGKVALIDMTLTSAACPLTDVIEDQSRTALVGAGLVNEIKINWVWNPPWGPGQDHRGRPRTAARARLHRLARVASSRPGRAYAASGSGAILRRIVDAPAIVCRTGPRTDCRPGTPT